MNREELLALHGQPKEIGPHGFVRLVDFMGDDAAVVQAARVSYGAGTKTPSDDRTLIRYLMRHRHTTPVEMVELKFHLKMPIHVARQWIRHRTASVNEYSTRYSQVRDEFEILQPQQWRTQSDTNKQGSSGLLKDVDSEVLDRREFVSEMFEDIHDATELSETMTSAQESLFSQAFTLYEAMLNAGIAREQARNVLPLATYTEMYWKIDLHNLLHFLSLRLDPHAQQEIREFSQALYDVVKAVAPVTAEAFEDYRLNGATMSAQELNILNTVVHLFGNAMREQGSTQTDTEMIANLWGLHGITNKREQTEFLTKLGLS